MTRLPVADRPAVRRALAGLVGTQRQAVTLVLVLHAAAAVAGLAAPWLLGRIVDAVTYGEGTGIVDGYALGIVGSVAAQGLLSRYAQYAGHRLSERAIATLREDFVDRTLRLPDGVVERAGTGDLATRSSVDVSTVGTTVRDVLPIMAVASAQLLLLFGAIFLLSPWLGLAALTGLPSISLVARWYLRRAGGAYLTEGAATAELTDTLTTTAEGTRTIEALSLRRSEAAARDTRTVSASKRAASGSPTRATVTCCTASTWMYARASDSPWSARPAPASPRWPGYWPDWTCHVPVQSPSAAYRSPTWTRPDAAARLPYSPRSTTSSSARCATT